MSRQNLPKLALAVLASLTFCAPTFASALLESAKQDFQLKRYHASADTLNKVVQAEPANPEGYYWLGRALEELKDRDGAKTMYMSAFKLNPFGPHAPLAKKAMMDLAVKQAAIDHPTDGPEVTAQTLQLIERETTDWKRMKVSEGNMRAQNRINAGNMATFNAGYYGGANMQLPNVPLPMGSNAPIQSISEIRAQQRAGGTAGNPYLNVGNPLTKRTYDNWAGYPGNGGAQNYYQPGAAGAIGFVPGAGGAGTGYGAPLTGGYGGGYGGYGAGAAGGYGGGMGGVGGAGGYGTGYGGYNPAQYNPINLYGRQPVSNLRQINTSYMRSDANVQALHAQQQGVQSAAELQKSANNLETLLGEKPRAGSPHLRALGTNLFVRNYSEHDDDSLPPSDPVLELKAKQEKLSDLDKGEHAKAGKL